MRRTRAGLRRLKQVHQLPGGLYGWHHADPPEKRHKSLRIALRHNSYARVVERLNLEAIRTKNESPETHRVAEEDLHWVQQNFGKRGY